MRLRITVGMSIAVSLAFTACGGNSSPTVPTPAQASLTVMTSPTAVTATRCDPACVGSNGLPYPYSVPFVINIQETAGISGNVNNIVITPSSGAGAQSPLTYGADVVTSRSGTNHITAHGSLSFPVTFFDTRVPLVVNIVVQFGDDKGNQITGTGQLTVS